MTGLISFLLLILISSAKADSSYQKLREWECNQGSIALWLDIDRENKTVKVQSYLSVQFIQDNVKKGRQGYLGGFTGVADEILQVQKARQSGNRDQVFSVKSGAFSFQFKKNIVIINGEGWKNSFIFSWKDAVEFSHAIHIANILANDGFPETSEGVQMKFEKKLRAKNNK